MEYKHTTIVCVDHPTRLVPSDPKHQAWAVSACRLPPAATGGLGFPVFCGGRGRDGTVGKKASCSVGWVCLQLGDGTLRKVQRVVFFFLTKKIGICHVCNNHITPQPVLFILCIPKRCKRKKNSVKRRCFILYSLPLSIHGLKNLNSSGNHVPSKCQILSSFPQQQKKPLVIPPEVLGYFLVWLAFGKSKSFLRKCFQKVYECLRQSTSGTLIMGSVKLSCVTFLLGKSF